MASLKKPLGNPKNVERKIPMNPRYSQVSSTLDTGGNVLKQKRAADEEVARFRKVEHFKRIKPRGLGTLLSSARLRGDDPPTDDSPNVLLIDLRDMEEYEQCHIEGAVHYDRPRINHATAPWTPPIMAHRNRPNCLIVTYDWDEGSGPDFANLIFEKGIDNVWVLTGGLRNYLQYFTDVVGSPPPGTPLLTKVGAPPTSMATGSVAPSRTSAAPSRRDPLLAGPGIPRPVERAPGVWR
eukprot:TRINITY_DN21767_c0_g1_i1.p1 TRINITY_DN21767_c0_g1~~TRINITY_DN21767_c0_g1_i1.p1  ORF type:complete len:238 (+),score=25.30 TRINITY_DN21767_c0_g1_i1:130-843(+)